MALGGKCRNSLLLNCDRQSCSRAIYQRLLRRVRESFALSERRGGTGSGWAITPTLTAAPAQEQVPVGCGNGCASVALRVQQRWRKHTQSDDPKGSAWSKGHTGSPNARSVPTGTVRVVTRIVSGRYGGRRLDAPAGRDTRPSSDRVREALFSALGARTDLDGARFADLFAGSGAVGLEAVSRGAAHALLVEADQRAAQVARRNVATLDAGTAVRITVDRVQRVLARPPDAPYDVVFADPPYAVPAEEVTAMLTALVEGCWLAGDATIVVERSRRGPELVWVPGITPDGVRHYGETALWYGRRS